MKYLKGKTTQWAAHISSGCLTQTDAYLAAISTIWKTIEYPLAALNLSMAELKTITWPVYQAAFKKMGVHHCVSGLIRDGPRRFLGLRFTSPFHTQGVRRLLTMVEHQWHNTPTGHLVNTNVESLIMELGIFSSLFDSDKSAALSWTTTPHTWLHAAITYAHEHDILIDLPFQWLKPIRQRDQSLMWGFGLRGLSYKDLLRLNRVRLFYRITCLA